MMKHVAVISMWIISFIFALIVQGSLFLISPVFAGPTSNQNRYLIVHDTDVEILTRSQANERFATTRSFVVGIDIYVKYEPKIVGGPFRGWLEFTETESFLDSEDFMFEVPRIGVPRLTADEISRAYQTILAHAQADSQVSHYQPGMASVTKFAPKRFTVSILRILMIFGFPTLTAYLIHRLFLKHREITIATRQKNGECIHCTYNCTKLQSPTCPECGQPHTVQAKSSVARLAEPGSEASEYA